MIKNKTDKLKSQFSIIPILPNKSQFQNPKRTKFWIWDFGFIWDAECLGMPILRHLVVFGFGICLLVCYLCFGISQLCFAQDKIMAIVNSEVITQKDLNDFINFTRMQLAAEGFKDDEIEGKIKETKPDLLNKLIEDRLILQEAKKNNLNIDEAMVKARISEIRKHYSSEAEFQNSLIQQGFVPLDIETKIREQVLMFSIINREVKSKIAINPGDVTEFYQKNIEKFKIPEQWEFESAGSENANLINDIYAQCNTGGDFEALVKKYSLDLDRIKAVKNGQLRKEIEDEVFKLEIGKASGPIQVQGRYYIFKLARIIPPSQQSLVQVQDKIYAMLTDNKTQEEITRWLEVIKSHSYIKITQDQP